MRHLDGRSSITSEFEIAWQAFWPEECHSLAEVPSTRRILAWPGWLDNSGSFEPIAPYFAKAGFALVACDPPGCGRSSHRSPAAWYHDFEEGPLVFHVADAIGWHHQPLILMGHSRGSNLMLLAAASFPERVRAAVLIESGLGLAGTYFTNLPDSGPDGPIMGRFDRWYAVNQKNRSRSPRVFEKLEDAINHNVENQMFPKSRQIGEAIVKRHVVELEDGRFTFQHDVRTYGQMQSRFIDVEANLAFLRSVQVPVVNIYAADSPMSELVKDLPFDEIVQAYIKRNKRWQGVVPDHVFPPYIAELLERQRAIPNYTAKIVAGKHHLHGDHPKEVFDTIFPWLEEALDKGTLRKPLPDFRALKDDLWLQTSIDHLLADDEAPALTGEDEDEKVDDSVVSENIVLEVDGLEIGLQRWGNSDSCNRVIAWPDKLDSSGSFDRLCKVICERDSNVQIVCVDAPGIGPSSASVPFDWHFGVSETAALTFRIAEELDWPSEAFSLWGHGFGASIALYAAGGIPDRIKSVILFDPKTTTIPNEWAPSELRQAYLEQRKPFKHFPLFKSKQDLISRLQTDPNFPKTEATATSIAQRIAVWDKKKSAWTYKIDPRLYSARKAVLEVPYAVFKDILNQVVAPVLQVIPSGSIRRTAGSEEMRVRLLKELATLQAPLTTVHVEGNSHVHSDCPRKVAQIAQTWMTQMGSMLSIAYNNSLEQNREGKNKSKL